MEPDADMITHCHRSSIQSTGDIKQETIISKLRTQFSSMNLPLSSSSKTVRIVEDEKEFFVSYNIVLDRLPMFVSSSKSHTTQPIQESTMGNQIRLSSDD
jgi:hypothetical protein